MCDKSKKAMLIGTFCKDLNNYCFRYKIDLIVCGFHQFTTGDHFIKFNYPYFESMPLDELEKLLSKSFYELGIKFYREV